MKNHKILSALAIAGAILLTSCEGIVVNPGQKNYAGEFIEVTSTRTLTAEWMADEIIRMAPDVALIKDIIKDVIGHDFVITNIAYWTKDPSGKLVKASGIVSYASDLTEYDHIVSSHHFTSDIVAAPSTRSIPPEMIPAWYGDAVVVAADYLGYGLSRTPDLQHPYLHNALTGSACADMINAAQEYLAASSDSLGLKCIGDRIDLMGYSQGGAAVLSTVMELEKRGMGDRIGQVWAGAAPSDIMAFFDTVIKRGTEPCRFTSFIAFLLRGLVYGDNLSVNLENLFTPRVVAAGMIKKFATTQQSTWQAILGTNVKEVLNKDFYAAPECNGNNDVKAMLSSMKRNSVIEQNKPRCASRIQLFHNKTDDIVPYVCSENLSKQWGCSLTELTTGGSHEKAGIEFFLRYLDLWDSLGEIILPLINI